MQAMGPSCLSRTSWPRRDGRCLFLSSIDRTRLFFLTCCIRTVLYSSKVLYSQYPPVKCGPTTTRFPPRFLRPQALHLAQPPPGPPLFLLPPLLPLLLLPPLPPRFFLLLAPHAATTTAQQHQQHHHHHHHQDPTNARIPGPRRPPRPAFPRQHTLPLPAAACFLAANSPSPSSLHLRHPLPLPRRLRRPLLAPAPPRPPLAGDSLLPSDKMLPTR